MGLVFIDGEDDDVPLLGSETLETIGLINNQFTRKLKQMNIIIALNKLFASANNT